MNETSQQLAGSMIGGIRETQEMLDFCAEHNITADVELIRIEQINEAYERLLKSDVKYRFVIDIFTEIDNGKELHMGLRPAQIVRASKIESWRRNRLPKNSVC